MPYLCTGSLTNVLSFSENFCVYIVNPEVMIAIEDILCGPLCTEY